MYCGCGKTEEGMHTVVTVVTPLSTWQMPEISNSTLSGSTRERGGGGRQLLLPALLALFSILFIVYPNDG